MTTVEDCRRWFAEELRCITGIGSRAVVEAFGTVPRERFLGPGPWRILSPWRLYNPQLGGYWTTEDADPRRLCHDVLVAIDEERRLNNGQPSLWASLYDAADIRPGAHVVHVGAGTGYFTAILAELVGRHGRVTALEVDPGLAERARANLFPWPQTTVVAANGFTYRPELPADFVIGNAGVSHVPLAWLDALAPDGRVLLPLTGASRWGGFLLVERRGDDKGCYRVRYVCDTGIIECVGGRDPDAEARLAAALQKSSMREVRSLHRDAAPDATCWLAGDGWWLSTAPAEGETP